MFLVFELPDEKDIFMKYFVNLFQEVEKYAKLVDSIQYNSQKVDSKIMCCARLKL